ncbi:MAG: hypothetical protein FWF25_04775 [Propionibacteriaceae bacterium]|nr:hypothetical protein [Propionibacteriaceae bacterium]
MMAEDGRQSQVRAFLHKAKEYLAVAEDSLEQERMTAAAGNAIHAGINSKDAIVIALTGTTIKSGDHQQAVRELRAALASRPEAAKCERALRDLIGAKSGVEYGVFMIEPSKAAILVRRAQTLVDTAARLAL